MRVACAVVIGVCAIASGCDYIVGISHIPDPPGDATVKPCHVKSASIGQRHGCAVDAQGAVFCWGGNVAGQVQPGGPTRVVMPTAVPLPSPAAQVSAGRDFTCARLDSGDVYCWGQNNDGQLGQGNADSSSVVRKIMGIPPSAEVRAGGGHACSRSATDGSIACWGRAKSGQTGVATTPQLCPDGQCLPPATVPNTAGAKALGVGHNSTCIIDASDHLICWGRNNWGQLGVGSNKMDANPPTMIAVGTVRAFDIAGRSMCVIDTTQRTFCMGEGEAGEIGNGTFASSDNPAEVFVNQPSHISTSTFGSCAILGDKTLACWGGINPGDGKPGAYNTPHPVPLANVTDVSGAYYALCATVDGNLMCWGSNIDGQLGRGTRGVETTLKHLDMTSPTAIALGWGHGCALANGDVMCWGGNDYNESGDPTFIHSFAPAKVTVPVTPTHVAAAYYKSCAWGGGKAACWGRAFGGQLGTGAGGRSATPAPVLKTNIRDADLAVAIGSNHLCVVGTDSAVTCFGNNSNFQLGDTTQNNSLSGAGPFTTGFDQVVAGSQHTCARKQTNEIWCWGLNNEGQIGDGTTNTRTAPAQTGGVGSVIKIAAGDNHTCALNSATEVWCWGRNNFGQVGNGTVDKQVLPVKVVPAGATDLVAGTYSTCAKINGVWSCWGHNTHNEFGNGSDIDVLVPTPIAGYAGATTIALGDINSCALGADGISCAGATFSLGTGDNSDSLPRSPALPSCQ